MTKLITIAMLSLVLVGGLGFAWWYHKEHTLSPAVRAEVVSILGENPPVGYAFIADDSSLKSYLLAVHLDRRTKQDYLVVGELDLAFAWWTSVAVGSTDKGCEEFKQVRRDAGLSSYPVDPCTK
jgi:hypothetical protein